ncbi:GNAT family N-acetyltransferase [Stenotrophomonas sp. S39]|uniref:GNAT family N-acetyltransferase n=1 Tax=Stenotrophomonas sp. S39 TaxID=2767451 RepID=UPI00190CA044|nr:GNAT family N-acetyltransferase [Stenotrophomonas sp. S39]MBK0053505.1 GNAT family N-acetyltransferase [Stenotrophomonas sp. S39]
MCQWSPAVVSHWDGLFDDGIRMPTAGDFSLVINPHLTAERRAMVMVNPHGSTRAALSPSIASALGIAPDSLPVSLQGLREALGAAGVAMHAPDVIYYVAAAGASTTQAGTLPEVRVLRPDDAAQFDGFMAQVPADDQDDASVELGHWATFGAFVESELLAVSSLYPWGGVAIADMGVLTMPRARGKGLARSLVRAMIEYASERGHEAQYRCQFDNVASNGLAESLGLTAYGKWEVARSP